MDFYLEDDTPKTAAPSPAPAGKSKPVKVSGPLRTNEANAVYAEILARKVKEARSATVIQRCIGLTALIALPFCLYYFGPKPWTYFLFFGWMLVFLKCDPEDIDEKDYYTIPGSRDKAGKHRCIYCGSGAKEIHHWGRVNSCETIYCQSCGKKAY